MHINVSNYFSLIHLNGIGLVRLRVNTKETISKYKKHLRDSSSFKLEENQTDFHVCSSNFRVGGLKVLRERRVVCFHAHNLHQSVTLEGKLTDDLHNFFVVAKGPARDVFGREHHTFAVDASLLNRSQTFKGKIFIFRAWLWSACLPSTPTVRVRILPNSRVLFCKTV